MIVEWLDSITKKGVLVVTILKYTTIFLHVEILLVRPRPLVMIAMRGDLFVTRKIVTTIIRTVFPVSMDVFVNHAMMVTIQNACRHPHVMNVCLHVAWNVLVLMTMGT